MVGKWSVTGHTPSPLVLTKPCPSGSILAGVEEVGWGRVEKPDVTNQFPLVFQFYACEMVLEEEGIYGGEEMRVSGEGG